ncbi:MAG: BlaI/MecI/CopY family transcriptional regulator [Phycisphaerae bacterium]
MADRHFELGDAELQVLRALWDRGRSTVREVMTELHGGGRRVAYTTVLTFLTRLEAKGYVTSDKTGLAYIYAATLSRERVTRSRLKTVVRQLYDGAAAPLVLQLMRTERFSPEEIAELQAMIDGMDVTKRRRSASRKV